jgi:hypothetical protein
VYFELLHTRLVDHLRNRVKSGELTERGLAKLAGISQPHLHNVLKGVRVLSAARADVVVRNLHLSALDLLREEELALPGHSAEAARSRAIPLAGGLLGPGHPLPDLLESIGHLTFSAEDLEGVEHPVAVRLADDPAAPEAFRAGDIVLLELLPAGCPALQPGGYYVIEERGCGVVRGYEFRKTGAWRVADGAPADPIQRAQACGSEGGAVRARVIWIGRFLQAHPNGAPVL